MQVAIARETVPAIQAATVSVTQPATSSETFHAMWARDVARDVAHDVAHDVAYEPERTPRADGRQTQELKEPKGPKEQET